MKKKEHIFIFYLHTWRRSGAASEAATIPKIVEYSLLQYSPLVLLHLAQAAHMLLNSPIKSNLHTPIKQRFRERAAQVTVEEHKRRRPVEMAEKKKKRKESGVM